MRSYGFLPSRDELNELCKYSRGQTTGDTGVLFNSSGEQIEGFSTARLNWFWSS